MRNKTSYNTELNTGNRTQTAPNASLDDEDFRKHVKQVMQQKTFSSNKPLKCW